MNLPWLLAALFAVAATALAMLIRAVTSGLATARVTLRTYDLPHAGRYLLGINGLEPADVGAPQHRVVLMRPHLARSILLVVAVTVTSALVIASLVLFLLAVIPAAAAIDPGRARGWIEVNGEHIEVTEAFAHLHRNPDGWLPFTPELRIVLADREVPQESLAGLKALPGSRHLSRRLIAAFRRLIPTRVQGRTAEENRLMTPTPAMIRAIPIIAARSSACR